MQTPTHILVGALIQQAVEKRLPRRLVPWASAPLALLSHGLLDKLARFTYHPPEAQWRDPFWCAFHAAVLAGSVALFRRYGQRYGWGVGFAVGQDLEWVASHGVRAIRPGTDLFGEASPHRVVSRALDRAPGVRALERLPRWTRRKEAALFEVALIALALWGLETGALHRASQRKRRGSQRGSKRAGKS
jgi:hypothetical protein